MSALFVCLVICCFILPAHSYQLKKALCEESLCLYLYEAGNTYLTWDQSHTSCRDQGLEMLRIESSQTQTTVDRLLQYLPQSTARQVWIGGRESSDDTWRYMNGTEFDKTTTSTTETDPYPYCINVRLCNNSSAQYVADNCDEKRSTSRVLCQYDKSKTGQCRSQDYESGDKCYVKTQYDGSDPNKIDWYSGQTYCSQSPIQGDIAYSYLDDNQHINDVVSLLDDGDGDGCVVLWFGVRRKIWFWKTDSGSDTSGQVIDYFNWFDEDTPIPSSDADCIYIDGDKGNKWRVQSCTGLSLNYFICMNASIATTRTTTTTGITATTTTGTTTTITTASTSANQSDFTNPDSGNKNQTKEQSGDNNSTSVVISATVVSVVVLAVGIGLAIFFVMRRKKRHPNTHHYVNDGIQPSLDNQTKSKEPEYAAVDIDTDNNDDVIDPYGTTSANNQPTPLINHSEAPSGDLYALSTKQANKMKENLNGKALKEKINKEKMESKESDRSEVRKYEEGPAGDLYAMPAKKNNKTPSDTNSD